MCEPGAMLHTVPGLEPDITSGTGVSPVNIASLSLHPAPDSRFSANLLLFSLRQPAPIFPVDAQSAAAAGTPSPATDAFSPSSAAGGIGLAIQRCCCAGESFFRVHYLNRSPRASRPHPRTARARRSARQLALASARPEPAPAPVSPPSPRAFLPGRSPDPPDGEPGGANRRPRRRAFAP